MLAFHEERVRAHLDAQVANDETIVRARNTVGNITQNIIEMFTHQALSRFKQAKDEQLLDANNSLVFYWSLSQLVLVVFAGFFQVFFIKRLFLSSSSSKASRRS